MRDYSQRLARLRAEITAREGELEALRAELAEIERLQLYADIIRVWSERYPDRGGLPSATIRDLLRGMNNRPYAEDWDSARSGQHKLSAAIGEEVESTKVREVPSQRLVQGYRREEIQAALERLTE